MEGLRWMSRSLIMRSCGDLKSVYSSTTVSPYQRKYYDLKRNVIDFVRRTSCYASAN